MSKNYIMLNGKRVDLTEEQLEKIGLKVEKECKDYFDRIGRDKNYYFINAIGKISCTMDGYGDLGDKTYKIGNYCTDKSIMEQRALHETLDRLLWRFSMQNDGDKIDWSNRSIKKYFIAYDYRTKKFVPDYIYSSYGSSIKYHVEYFYSAEVTQRAIDEIVLPFMKEHPEFVW